MRIVVVSTVYFATPPVGYGGIERVVHTYVEELVRQGHDVTLFCTLGSRSSARMIQIPDYDPHRAPSAVMSDADKISEEPLYEAMREYVSSNPVDLIHDWSFENLFVLRHPERCPFLISTCFPQAADYDRPNVVACSAAHNRALGGKRRHVHYGLNLDDWEFSTNKGKHLVHIAKIARYKGQHEAILASRKAGLRLILAGNVEDRLYHNVVVRPLVWISPNVRYVGEIKGTNRELVEAKALVQTPKWFDCFPLIVLESMASATPVISYDAGGTSEQIKHGVNGFLLKDSSELVEAMARVDEIDPSTCRDYAREHFSVSRMAERYLSLGTEVRDGVAW